MPKTETIVVRTQEDRMTAIDRMNGAGLKLTKEEPSSHHQGSTILTFEEEEDNVPTPDSFGFPEDPNLV
jgi:hypothetical protein